ncbi:conserved hypothetical protein [Leishmania infantum JPCM5]|uniref:Uncharacterized protein n=2 Tax=Leishmania infantum TaxID=5671 RepID=A4HWG2_LEIIN|nr:conserved hypothetical protein [Leishmania infantum JPCM5]CAC9472186.1 Kelch_motif/Galactose_oxidase_-_central_domain_containing_protein_-_putative [Leishmania infantum]CAM66788.2 conserved hypothetical protein [Leishmania infantum JPCM5]SUZ40480.1 Kelch_motif/Galactose_oxidase_-_central_domain_containing_protein_-_putative [Leishmania infantum]|eukprot:XP_001464403.2 conserved hypothetical protein [Leishmania infantum JPCM5]
MSTVPQYMGCFTLLYADPEVKEQHQYLQPLYGLTADDDPPAPLQLPWGFSQDASASTSSISSSLTSQDDVQGSISGSQRTASVDEPAAQRHKHSQTTAGALPRPTNSPGAKDDDDSEARQAPTAAPVRPPRKINHVGLSLYPDLSTGIVGPQPVFGGAALSAAEPATTTTTSSAPSAAAAGVPQPYLFASNGTPMLSSVVDPDALQKLQEARRPYPAPQPRSGHVLLPCPERGSLIMFGGLGDVPFNDVWEYDVRTGRWAELPCVPASEDEEDEEDEEELLATQQRRSHMQRSGNRHLEDEDAATSIGTPSITSSSSDDEDDDDDSDDMHEGDEEGTRAAAQRLPRRRQCRNMPPPAYGQAASLYQDVNGETCMAILGGISVGDICCSGFFSLNLNRLTWRRVQTTIPFFDMWGATAQTLYAPRRSSVLYTATTPGAAADEERGGDEGNGTRVSAEEQVVVLFGGMTEEGEVVRPVTHLFHFDHRLTAAEIDSNPDMYLKSIEYEKSEYARIMRRVLAEEDIADVHTTGENGLSPSIETRCSQWREAHPNTLMRWRRRALEKMAGKYWVEYLPAPEDLHGRRRSTSAAYKRHFMYIFGGRDDFYFYNDLWCLNLITRTWVQVREGVPPHLLRSFLAEPYNPMYGILINDRGAQLRQETITKTEAKLLHNSTNGTINPMYRARDVHHALFASSVNSSARARTGACMVVDVQRDCLYVYGGFSYTGQQHLTFFDLHAFYIGENVWRRVCICRERPWEVMIDAAADAVGIVNPAEEGRPYARHASPSSAAGAGGQTMGSGAPSLPPTLMGYAARYLQGDPFTTASASGILVAASLGPPLAPRGSRTSRMPNTHSAPGAHRNCFHLPSFVPEARTMAAMVEDPVHPGARFFLHGGRSGEEACGDFFELRTYVGRTVDMEYMKLHRAAREEVVGLVSTRSSAGTNTLATPSALLSNPPATSVTTSFLTAADAASGLSATDAARLQWNSRRQLQRQLVSAALETQEGFEDMPAAHYSSINDTVPLPRRTLRDAATRWIRDGLAAVDPKSLMFVELRNGHAVVNLRTHIHYLSRLSLLGGGSGDGSGHAEHGERGSAAAVATTGASSTSSAANYTLNARTGTLAGTGSNISASSALATPMQFESMDGHLKRSARSLELLLYDVLLSKPINNGGGAGVGCSGGAARASCHRRTCSSTHMPGIEPATSPSTRGVAMATSPEVLGMFPSYPGSVFGGSPGTSPGSGTPLSTSPQVQIVSRAQYSTPRTPQVLSMTLSGNSGGTAQQQQQQQLSTSFPSQGGDSTVLAARDARASSPALTSGSSSFCGSGGVGGAGFSTCGPVSGGASPANNEYAYHVLFRSLFHHEPFYRPSYAADKKR